MFSLDVPFFIIITYKKMSICNKRKRVFRILNTLPFFKALCDNEVLVGIAMFDPILEEASLLVTWLEFRLPGSRVWSSGLERGKLDRAVLRDMLLHGSSPGLGTFVDWEASTPSLAFLAAWLGWYGIVPSPDMNAASRSEEWWRSTAKSQLDHTRTLNSALHNVTPRNARADSNSIQLLVAAAATTRAIQGRLLESLELFEGEGLARLSPKNFEVLLRTLATVQFPATAAICLSSESKHSEMEGNTAWNVGRRLRAISASTGTATNALQVYMRAHGDRVRATRAHIATDPRSNSPVNSQFYAKYGLDVAMGAARAAKFVGPYLIRKRTAFTIGKVVSEAMGWRDMRNVVESIIELSLAAATSDQKGTGLAFAKLLIYLRDELVKDKDTITTHVPAVFKVERRDLLLKVLPAIFAIS